MNKLIIALILIGIPTTFAVGQNLRGGFGHAFFGLGFNVSPSVQNDLQVPELLGNGLQLNRFGKFGGGGGYGVFGKKFLLGGSGMGYKVADATDRGQATLSMGGGFVNIGYLAVVKESVLAFPYIGIGGNGLKLKLKNSTADEVFNVGGTIISPGEYVNLNSGGMSFEFGYAVKFLTFSIKEEGGNGGLMVGLQAGAYLFTGIGKWYEESTDDLITTFSNPSAFSPYLRITIGGGGFSMLTKK